MLPSLEPQILQGWLAPFDLSLETLTELPGHLKAELLQFWLPEEIEFEERDKTAFYILGWAVGARMPQKTGSKNVWRVLFRLFVELNEPGPAAYTFSNMWPVPEPTKVTYFSELVNLYLAQGDEKAAEKALTEMQEYFPDRYTTFVTEAKFYLYRRDFAAAKAAYLEGLEISPLSSRLMLNLAEVTFQQTQTEEAIAWLEEAERQIEPAKSLSLQAARLWKALGFSEKANQIYENYALYKEQKQTYLIEKLQEFKGEIQTQPLISDPDIEAGSKFEFQPVDEIVAEPFTLLSDGWETHVDLPQSAYEILKKVFGYTGFRPGQKQVIANILARHATLAILPTGAGKSLCYQLPALVLDRPVLVISPLISLMKDQFDKLPAILKESTLVINSSQEPVEVERQLQRLGRSDHSVRLIYAAPERLRQTPFIKALSRGGLGLVVIDEAHCVTMWGNDFRPDYLFIRRALSGLDAPLLALTATATPQVTQEIIRELGMNFKVVRGSVFRPNLTFSVEKILTRIEERLDRVVELCQTQAGSGIIYTRSREKCEQIAEYLRKRGLNARPYHAGMDSGVRQQVQESWASGQTEVVVATVAFGMGIDKPDVRYIIHFNPATSLENYVQEAGRAGRDGLPAQCIMLYSSGDKANLSRWLREENEQFTLEILREIYRIITRRLGQTRRGIISMNEILAGSYSVFPPPGEGVIQIAFSILEGAGLLERGFDLPSFTRISVSPLGSTSALPADLADFLKAIGLEGPGPVSFDLVAVASRLAISPPELDSRLIAWNEAGFMNYQVAKREPYFELKNAGNDVRARLENLLAQRFLEAEKRLDKLNFYLKNRACRQVLLANYFGEKLGHKCSSCDNCTQRERHSKMAPISKHTASTPPQPVKPVPKYSPDEITALILGCLRHITGGEGQLGRSGLVHLLMGKRSAFGTTANNPYKGKFAAFRVKEVENLVEKLALTGFIGEHPVTLASGRTYQAIQVSDRGHLWLEDHQDLLP
jgi:ATP-dependent DNA helicase RecQ